MTDLERPEPPAVAVREPVQLRVIIPRLVAPLALVATFVLCVFPMSDHDIWWHLKTGQLIWERGEVPQTDWYLFTDSNRPWIDLHWGFQLLAALVYGLGGANLLILTKAAVNTAAVGMGWFAVPGRYPDWLRAIVWIPAIICITGRAYERPEMMSLLFLASWFWIAFRVERQPRLIWILPVIQVVWINLHALFILGLVIGGCFVVDYAIRLAASGRFGLRTVPAALKPRLVFGAGTCCALAALVNPYFVAGALFPLELYRKFSVDQEFYSTRIGEFQDPLEFFELVGFGNLYLSSELLLGVMGLVSFVAAMMVTGRWSPFRVLVFLAFGNLALEASRNVNIFAITAAIVTAANVSDLWLAWTSQSGLDKTLPKSRARPVSRNPEPGSRDEAPSLRAGLDALTCGVMLVWIGVTVTGAWGRFAGEGKVFGLGERPWWFGHEAVQFAGQERFPKRAIISHIGLAATYEYHNAPTHKVLLDPRLEVSTIKTYQLQDTILELMVRANPVWEQLARDESGNLPVVILDSRNSRLAINGMFQMPGWRLVHADPAAAVFLSDELADSLNLAPADYTPLLQPP